MTRETTLRIPAIHCGGCANSVRRNLKALPGVSVTDVDPRTKLVRLSFDESEVSLDQIRESLDGIGFSPDDEEQGQERNYA